MERDPVAGLDAAEVAQQRGEFVDSPVELRVRDLFALLILELGYPDERVLVAARLEVAIDAVHAGVEAPADPPLPERRIARIEDRVPLAVPREHVRVLLETFREVLRAEALEDRGVVRVRLLHEPRRRWVVLLLTPVNGDLRLGDFCPYFSHRVTSH
jgi:hypothetical protein